MRIQQIFLVLMVSVSLFAMSAPEAWSQSSAPFGATVSDADPFGGSVTDDPFGGSSQKQNVPKKQDSEPVASDNPFNDPFGGSSAKPKTNSAGQSKTKQATSNHQNAEQVGGESFVKVVSVGESDADQRIHAALQDETSNTFVSTPLDEAVRVLSQAHKIPMLIDKAALEGVGLTADTPVDISLSRVSLRSFLRLMLRDLELTYMIKDEVLQITTIEAAEQSLETRMYRLPEFLVPKTDQVLVAMQSALAPESWSTTGGPAVATSIDHVLIVSTTSDVHQEVLDYLETLIHMHEEE